MPDMFTPKMKLMPTPTITTGLNQTDIVEKPGGRVDDMAMGDKDKRDNPSGSKAPPTGETEDWMDAFESGTHRGIEYPPEAIDKMHQNFQTLSKGENPLLEVPLVVGHDEDQSFLEDSGYPAGGWAHDSRVVPGSTPGSKKLQIKAREIPPELGNAINGKRFKKTSAEVYDDFQHPVTGESMGPTLRRQAILGAEVPQVKTLSNLPKIGYKEQGGKFKLFGGLARFMECYPDQVYQSFAGTGTPEESGKMVADLLWKAGRASGSDPSVKVVTDQQIQKAVDKVTQKLGNMQVTVSGVKRGELSAGGGILNAASGYTVSPLSSGGATVHKWSESPSPLSPRKITPALDMEIRMFADGMEMPKKAPVSVVNQPPKPSQATGGPQRPAQSQVPTPQPKPAVPGSPSLNDPQVAKTPPSGIPKSNPGDRPNPSPGEIERPSEVPSSAPMQPAAPLQQDEKKRLQEYLKDKGLDSNITDTLTDPQLTDITRVLSLEENAVPDMTMDNPPPMTNGPTMAEGDANGLSPNPSLAGKPFFEAPSGPSGIQPVAITGGLPTANVTENNFDPEFGNGPPKEEQELEGGKPGGMIADFAEDDCGPMMGKMAEYHKHGARHYASKYTEEMDPEKKETFASMYKKHSEMAKKYADLLRDYPEREAPAPESAPNQARPQEYRELVRYFNEKIRRIEMKTNQAVQQVSSASRTALQQEVRIFCEQLVKDGKILRAEKDLIIEDLLMTDNNGYRTFAEEGKVVKATMLQQKMRLLYNRPKTVKFGERFREPKNAHHNMSEGLQKFNEYWDKHGDELESHGEKRSDWEEIISKASPAEVDRLLGVA